MAQQAGGAGTGSGALSNQFGDTTYTKVFVGGLAWETQRDTMRRHFEQFGDILEAVVITDKNTGRSKGYGFVTFRDPEAARRACADATPIIDGRRANCNLASLGAHRHRPHGQHEFPTISSMPRGLGPERGRQGNRFRPVSPFSAGPQQGGPGYTGGASFPQPGSPFGHPAQQASFTYPPAYGGYPQYPQDYASYPPNLFQYGAPQYAPQMYGGPGTLSPGAGPVFPYGSFTTQPLQGGPGYPATQYAPHLVPYSPTGSLTSLQPPAYGGAVTIPTSAPTAGLSLSAGPVAGSASTQQYTVPAAAQQPYSGGGGSEQSTG